MKEGGKEEWPWNVPKFEFWPLGDEKLKQLKYFVRRIGGFDMGGKDITSEELVKVLESDRHFASQAYVAFKAEIEHLMATDPYPEFNKNPGYTPKRAQSYYKTAKNTAAKAPTKPKAKPKAANKAKPKAKAKSKPTKPMGQVIDFTAYKQKIANAR
jgi:hypothetical protein